MTCREVESGNRLLDALRRECPDLRGVGEQVTPPSGAELASPGRTLTHVYFPVATVVSVMVGLASGATAEVCTAGREGLVGLDAWLGVPINFGRTVHQGRGALIRMTVREFCDGLGANRRARKLLQAYTAYVVRFAQQTAVCNAVHSVEQRTCRWLLGLAQRVGSPTLGVTHELLAEMLAVRRQSIGEVAVALQQAGLISYRRSELTLVDRGALERRACDCWRAIDDAYRAIVDPLL